MGDILPFFAKVRARGDWSAVERERLAELADRFGGDAEGIDIVFGETDEGEPWCVVKDAEDEVLVHVARIGGRFVVHYAENDGLREGSDLPALLGQQLQWETEDDVVVPFSRRAQSFLALLVATAFFYELHEHGPDHAGAHAEEGHAPADLLARALGNEAVDGHAVHENMLAIPGHWGLGEHVSFQRFDDPDAWSDGVDRSGLQEAASPQPDSEPAHAATLQPAVFVASPAHVAATPPAVIQVSAAAPGSDHVPVSTTGVTTGHGGGDTFVLHTPDHMGDASVLLGTIAGYDAADDRLITAGGTQVTIVATLEPLRTMSVMAHVSRPVPIEAQTETKLLVDLNGDGVADGYVLLAPSSGPDATASSGAHVASLSENNALMLAGQTLDHYLS